MTLSTDQVLQGRYRIVSLLEQGGMGAVYRAWDTRLDVPIALKEMIPQPGLDAQTLSQLRQQFQHEAQVLARLNHPHLVRVTDYFEEGGKAYLVMKFIEGESLAHRIEQQGALSEEEALDIAGQLLKALAYCHSNDVIHRDVKPQNVIIQPDGQCVLVDFGLVKLWDPHDPRTRPAIRGIGTPEYSPPEQYSRRMGHTNPRSDLYSLGATLYHALTGQAPPTVTDRMADRDQFVPIRELNPRVSPQTERAISKAVKLSPEERWQDARRMAKALGKEAPVFAKAKPSRQETAGHVLEREREPARARKSMPGWVWALGGGALIILAVGAVTAVIWGGKEPSGATPTAVLPGPTKTLTLSPSPTHTPTQTPKGPTVTPASRATPETPEASPPPTTQIPATAPTLILPEEGRTYEGPITFRWQGTLGAEQSYQVRAWHPDSNTVVRSPLLSATTWTTDLPAEKAGGWHWEVSVLDAGAALATSDERMFWFNPFADQGGDGGSGGSSNSSPPPSDNR